MDESAHERIFIQYWMDEDGCCRVCGAAIPGFGADPISEPASEPDTKR